MSNSQISMPEDIELDFDRLVSRIVAMEQFVQSCPSLQYVPPVTATSVMDFIIRAGIKQLNKECDEIDRAIGRTAT